MHAPWKPGLANRDPFAAFVCDDATLDLLRQIAGDLGFAPEKCAKGNLRSAVQSLSVAASPAILMIDLSECGDPLNDINALAEVCEPGTVVIALGRVNDVRLYRQLMASGIHDYLLKPVSAEQLKDTLTQARDAATTPRGGDADAPKSHIATAVIGTRGGVGASTLATSLGWLFATEHKLPTALLDLDVHFGTAALSLDLEPGRGLIDAIANPSRIDGLFIERAMIRAADNLAILSAEAPISSALTTDGAAFVQLEEEFRQSFDMSVVDLPRNMLIAFPHLLSNVNNVVLVTEMTLASARDAIRILSWLRTTVPNAQPLIVANKVHPGAGEIGKADFEASIEHKVNFSIPFDQKCAVTAAKLGQTLAEAGRSTKIGTTLRALARTVVDSSPDTEADLSEPAGASLLGRFDFKSLMARKPFAKAGPAS
jgi:pilus assembly protein CpaE